MLIRDTSLLIARAMEAFDKYHLKNYSKDHMVAYFKYRMSDEWNTGDVSHSHFLLFADDSSTDAFILSFRSVLKKLQATAISMYSITEAELLEDPSVLLTLKKDDILVIRDCPEAAMTAEEAAAWTQTADLSTAAACPTMILAAKSEVVKKRFQSDEPLCTHIFNDHLEFKTEYDEADILDILKETLDHRLGWQRDDNFNEALNAYVHQIYYRARLKNMAFVEDMVKQINALYYHKNVQNKILDIYCIPFYIGDVVSETPAAASEDTESTETVQSPHAENTDSAAMPSQPSENNDAAAAPSQPSENNDAAAAPPQPSKRKGKNTGSIVVVPTDGGRVTIQVTASKLISFDPSKDWESDPAALIKGAEVEFTEEIISVPDKRQRNRRKTVATHVHLAE